MDIEPSDLGDEEFSDYISRPEHNTNILPLRWFGNFCNLYPAHWAMHRALYYEDKARYFNTDLDKAGHRWWRLYEILNKPYEKWGTVYVVFESDEK